MVSEPTATRIASAARSLLDAEGVDAVTMRRVAAGVDITAMALYRHYADRDALLNALADDGFTELMKRLSYEQREVTLASGAKSNFRSTIAWVM